MMYKVNIVNGKVNFATLDQKTSYPIRAYSEMRIENAIYIIVNGAKKFKPDIKDLTFQIFDMTAPSNARLLSLVVTLKTTKTGGKIKIDCNFEKIPPAVAQIIWKRGSEILLEILKEVEERYSKEQFVIHIPLLNQVEFQEEVRMDFDKLLKKVA